MAYKTIQTQTLMVAKTDSIKRGFVKHFVDFISEERPRNSDRTPGGVHWQAARRQEGHE